LRAAPLVFNAGHKKYTFFDLFGIETGALKQSHMTSASGALFTDANKTNAHQVYRPSDHEITHSLAPWRQNVNVCKHGGAGIAASRCHNCKRTRHLRVVLVCNYSSASNSTQLSADDCFSWR
jgi:hypothetical protein